MEVASFPDKRDGSAQPRLRIDRLIPKPPDPTRPAHHFAPNFTKNDVRHISFFLY